jgi:transcriptional regulator with XRE-family HTH domain
MALLSVIRRWAFRDGMSIQEITRRTGLSRNTIRKYLRSDAVEPKFEMVDRPSKLDRFADRLSGWLKTEASKSRKQRRTGKQIHADLAVLGYEQTTGRGTFVPLVFMAGEAFQFDWSEDWAILGGERVKLQAALSCPLLSGPSTMTAWTKEGTTNACQEAQARGDHREAA